MNGSPVSLAMPSRQDILLRLTQSKRQAPREEREVRSSNVTRQGCLMASMFFIAHFLKANLTILAEAVPDCFCTAA